MEFNDHTYGPSCILYSSPNTSTQRLPAVSQEAPHIKTHFFYSSFLPIDDPLSALPPTSTSTNSRLPIRPFSAYDNALLEDAWQSLEQAFEGRNRDTVRTLERMPSQERQSSHEGQDSHRNKNDKYRASSSKTPASKDDLTKPSQNIEKNITNPEPKLNKNALSGINQGSSSMQGDTANNTDNLGNRMKPGSEESFPQESKESQREAGRTVATNCASTISTIASAMPPSGQTDKDMDKDESQPNTTNKSITKSNTIQYQATNRPRTGQSGSISDDPEHIDDNSTPVTIEELNNEAEISSTGNKPYSSRNKLHERIAKSSATSALDMSSPSAQTDTRQTGVYGSSPADRHTTGNPFQRALSRHKIPNFVKLKVSQQDGTTSWSEEEDESLPQNMSEPLASTASLKHKYTPVGVSRLHLVDMPDLEMKPIYWSPIHDVAAVVRGTWFYKNTMLPVESELANMLEKGYEYMQPWTPTYEDEVNSCLEIGPEAELKLAHKLWPTKEPQPSDSNEPQTETPEDNVPYVNRAAGSFEIKPNKEEPPRLYEKSSVIYANAREAQILRPSLLPSVARGRRPLGPIRKGKPIGVQVVRGFDSKAWDGIYKAKKTPTERKAAAAAAARRGAAATFPGESACPACEAAEAVPKVTDLVLVIHGIGQKLSERVESFHFTHAINALRREMAVELASDAINPVLRDDLGGLMVLPVNWRSTLSLEDGGFDNRSETRDSDQEKEYTLKDITVGTLPAIRNIVSDVMLDIPYYLSHHKSRLIEAVIKEANRIYRLWCRNNPGFERDGRVHIVAHSLGSVMALDILSNQPTKLPEDLNLTSKKVSGTMFEFDTTNLFFCGSPAGFFLLLNHARLIPRKGRHKPGVNPEDVESSRVCGEAGKYGCLAVDNIYNIMHTNDPVAYRVNAAVDVDYSDSLLPASIPRFGSSWFQSIGYLFRGKPATIARPPAGYDSTGKRPSLSKLPSQMELEVHNFTQEELAEKKMYLLNDNGQIDYYLSSGGGPLEIQYLNMLSAHSSYWVLQDFIRFLVIEIGRKAGREETLLAMRAAKKGYLKNQQEQKRRE